MQSQNLTPKKSFVLMKLEPNIAKIISFNIINKYISIRQSIYICVTLLLTLSIINFSLDLKVSNFIFELDPV